LVLTDKEISDATLQSELGVFVNSVSLNPNTADSDKFFVIKKGETKTISGSQITFNGFSTSSDTSYGNEFKQYFDNAVSEYQEVHDVYDGDFFADAIGGEGDIGGQKALKDAFNLAINTRQNTRAMQIAQTLRKSIVMKKP